MAWWKIERLLRLRGFFELKLWSTLVPVIDHNLWVGLFVDVGTEGHFRGSQDHASFLTMLCCCGLPRRNAFLSLLFELS